jgi:chondroitin 4-sulfotransferase 11
MCEQIYGRTLSLPPKHPIAQLQRVVRGLTSQCSLPADQVQCGMLFIHVPKTGGKSIEQALSLKEQGHTPISYFLLHHARSVQPLYKFSFVRNPFDRLVSAFHYLKSGGGNSSDARWAKRMLRGIKTCDEFIKALASPHYQSAVLSGVHFRPQHDFLSGPNGELAVNFIGHFERLENDFSAVAARLEITAELPHTNRSARPANWQQFFESETGRRAVVSMYKADFSMFGYEMEF